MNGRITGSIALAAFVLLAGASALAQDTPPTPGPAAPAAVDSAAAASSAAPAGSAAPKSTGVITGYAYKTHSSVPSAAASGVHHARIAHHANEAVAKVSGFEMLPDGGSRLFVQLSRQVDVDQAKDMAADNGPPHGRHGRSAKQGPRAALTRLTFMLKGTELTRANDANSLETIDFNTPVVRARLQPSGRDLRFVILLRADVTPTMKIIPAKDNGAMLQIDFPQGSYVAPGANGVPGATGTNEPVNGALPSNANGNANGNASGNTNGSGDTNDSMGPQ
jgi:hypothetical protein